MRCSSQKTSHSRGFTLVEVMVISPIIILTITGIIALIIILTGDVLRVKGTNDLVYNTQGALDVIEQDVQRATEFRQTSYTPPSPQGENGSIGVFDTISQASTILVLRSPATTKSPDSDGRKLVYQQSGATCSTTPYTFDTVYFTEPDPATGTDSLWRRVILGSTAQAGSPCTGMVAWQTPSCAPGTVGTPCQSEDTLMLENVSAATVRYLNATGGQINTTTPNAGSAIRNPNDASGTTNARSIEFTLSTLNTVAGRENSYNGLLLASKAPY